MKALALAALAIGGAACASIPPVKQAQVDLLECRAQALAPAVEPAIDAAELAHDLYLGRASLPAVLRALDVGEAEVRALIERLRACEPEPAPAALPETIPG